MKIVAYIVPNRLSSLWCPASAAVAIYVDMVLDSDEFWQAIAEGRKE